MGILREYLLKISEKNDLSFEEAKEVSKHILSGDVTEAEIGAFLLSLRTKGEIDNEIAGMASGMREVGTRFKGVNGFIIDNCGTGGDNLGTFNISTTASFVLAGAGLKVAKHGNRSISSKSGSSDLLSELGVKIDLDASRIENILEEVGIVFLFAPKMHPLMKNVMQTRVNLQVPTVFNLLGPLTNPFDLDGQLLGIYRRELVPKIASILSILGRKNAIVVNGFGGMDEASLEGENYIAVLRDGIVEEKYISGSDFGFNTIKNSELKGGTPKENAKITLDILNGKKGAHRDIVIFNAALGLLASNFVRDIKEGVEIATESIDSGKAINKLNLLAKESNR
ncbi:anthranilate phosphoribosyltransferase [Clostridium cylindrosporum]|uniref:Anthranilate phosphoribosyltransferase n=1 Tax=Clostridium cylindrosporum DSM 605 TaxID=1121307 RepID=A0A0J8D529_CLOCY|nr:anthranilate phosphoribosyltransferase [Clostridium cylindrosporum]KMT20922.1 anthranilate phosphoribosyltransferase TrpD [Clostridium cylindrosporum DSM 605]